MKLRTISALVVALAIVLVVVTSRLTAEKKADVLWDKFGVPHIFATDRASMFYAHGWAQMQNQANLLLRLYGESRGRGAEYWGPSNLELDRWVQLNDVPERAKAWYTAQDPTFRSYLDAFARGINDFAKAHPEAIDADKRLVLPVTGVDVVGHPLRAVHYGYMASPERVQREVNALKRGAGAVAQNVDPDHDQFSAGSNTWTIGPAHSASGHAMLLINPHLAWGNTFYRYMEVHLVVPTTTCTARLSRFSVAVVGFNRHAGWGRTVNTIDTGGFLQAHGERTGSTSTDGQPRPFERSTKTAEIKQPMERFREETLEIRKSFHGTRPSTTRTG
jgi:acyl-homoserine-lactone acylase